MAYTHADIADARRVAQETASPQSYYRLGLIYSTGEGAPIDLIEAHKWFNLAALGGFEAAKAYRRECADMMSKAEISAAQRAAREWLNALTGQGPVAPPAPVVKPEPVAPAKPVQAVRKQPASIQRFNRLKRYVGGSAPVFAA